jgi:hypothetical protein
MKQQRLSVRGFAILCAALISTSSLAATTSVTVNPAKGVVLINRGKGFSQIKKPTRVKPGNQVMVGPEGSAVIAYADGCTMNVAPGAVETVNALSQCASGSVAQNNNNNNYQNPDLVADGVVVGSLVIMGTIVYLGGVSP